MKKRQFRVDKLYKLSRAVVILCTVVAIFLVWVNHLYIDNLNNRAQQMFDTCRKYLSDDMKGVNDCEDRLYSKPIQNAETMNNNSLIVAIFLPTIFFGGTWIYRYLFPIKEEKQEKEDKKHSA